MEIDSVKLSKLEKIYLIAKESSQGEDIDLSFTYIVGSCFPQVFQNVQKKTCRSIYERLYGRI